MGRFDVCPKMKIYLLLSNSSICGMHTFMHEVRFNETGNAVTLVKRAVPRASGSLENVESVDN